MRDCVSDIKNFIFLLLFYTNARLNDISVHNVVQEAEYYVRSKFACCILKIKLNATQFNF